MVIPGPPERCSSSSLNLGGLKSTCIPLHGPSFKSFLTILRSMMIAQNGPGITNFVTPVKTAYWNHTPLLLVTPQAVWFDILEQRPDFSVFFFSFFWSFDFLIMKCMISCVEFRDMVRYICTVRPPTRPLVREDSKKWSRWPCSKIVFATKKRRLF